MMKHIRLAFTLFGLLPFGGIFGQSQDEVARQIQDYIQLMRDHIEPTKAAFEELNQHYANRRTGSMSDAESKIELVGRADLEKLDAVKPLYGETQLIEATREFLRVMINGTQDEFPKITNRYKVANPTQADQDAVVEYTKRFNAKWSAADAQFVEATENLFIQYWCPLGNKQLCPALDEIINDVPNKFESLKGKEDEMIPSTWALKNPFPSAMSSRCMFIQKPTVLVVFMESPDFQQVASAQQAMYFYVRSCLGDRFAFSKAKLKPQAEVDQEGVSSYSFGDGKKWEGLISVDKSYSRYRLLLRIVVNE